MEPTFDEENQLSQEGALSDAGSPIQPRQETSSAEGNQAPYPEVKKPKKVRKILLWILAAIVILAAMTPTVILPEIQKAQAYSAANRLLEQGAYQDAEAAFLALGTYRKAPDQACEARYRMADEKFRQSDFAEAVSVWQALGAYSDSAARAEQALDAWHGPDYEAAAALMAKGQYEAAAERFLALSGYRDSAAQAQSCLETQQAIDYEAASTAFAQGDYATALPLFQKLESYKDAETLCVQSAYLLGCDQVENAQYKEAIASFETAGNYEDAPGRVLEATYLYAGQLFGDGAYSEAIVQYQNCGDYQDAAQKILDTKYAYAQNNLDQSDKTTLSYLSELIAAEYPGAKALEDELYAWKAVFLGFNNSPNSTDPQARVSKYYTMYAHFLVVGGRPGESTTVRVRLNAPNGQHGTVTYKDCYSDFQLYISFYYYDPAAGATGTISASLYSEQGVYLAGGSAEVVD